MSSRRNVFLHALSIILLFTLLVVSGQAQASDIDTEIVIVSPEADDIVIWLDKSSPSCLKFAVRDFVEDAFITTGKTLRVVDKCPERCRALLIPCLIGQDAVWKQFKGRNFTNHSLIKGKWETFLIEPAVSPNSGIDHALFIVGSDPRSAMFGVYELSERVLGTDPLSFWTDYKPQHKDKVVWRNGKLVVGPPTFKFRGLFINDESSLLSWKGEQPADGVVEPEIQAEIIETICRLKGNFIAPAMYAEYMTPETLQLVNDRGLYYSASHMELLLANPMVYWHRFCQERWGEKLDYSYTQYPDKLRAFWLDSIERHRDYANIWPIGLRGIYDWAFWRSDPAAPKSIEGRVEVVEKVLHEQLDMLKQNLQKDIFPPTSLTMYEEIEDLYRTGLMDVPEDVMFVWCDYGWVARLRGLPNKKEQKRSGGNGVYFHIENCDRQWTQFVPLEHLQQEFKKVVAHKATKYVLFNVGDIREVPLSIAAGMDLAWNAVPWCTKKEQPNEFLHTWVDYHFGESAAKRASAVYRKFYDLEYPCACTWVVELIAPYTVSEKTATLWEATSATKFLQEVKNPLLLQAYASVVDFSKVHQRRGDVVDIQLVRKAATQWDTLYEESLRVSELVEPERKQFFFDNMICQIQTSRMINHWALEILDGFEACKKADFLSASEHFNKAAFAMDTIEQERIKVSHGKWRNWFRGENYHGWQSSLWALKPKIHSHDASVLADLSKAALALQQEQPLIITPEQSTFKVTSGLNEKENRFTFSLGQNFNPEKAIGVCLVVSASGIDNSDEAAVVFNGSQYPLPVTGNSKNAIFKIDLDFHSLKNNDNLVEFILSEDKSIANNGYSIMNHRLIVSTSR